MSRKTAVKYTDGEIGRVKVVKDFLPRPDQLVLREATVKVTLSLSQRSVDFFMATSGEAEIGRIFLMGGTARIPLLPQAIERRARVQVEVFSPVEKIAVDGTAVDPTALAGVSAQLAVALGLAMRKDREKRA